MTLKGLFCKSCGATVVDARHEALHNREVGDYIVWKKHDDRPRARVTKVRRDGYEAVVVENSTPIWVPEENLDEFEIPEEEELE